MRPARFRWLAAASLLWLGCWARTTPETKPDADTPSIEDEAQETFVAGSPHWWNGAVFYEVFVRSFQDSGSDGIGDFAGLTARLDYLNDGKPETQTDLGVNALWLMPVFESPSYHGYDTTHYERIEPDYGTQAEFDAFIAAAHARGIKVIVDLVLNHSSDQHPWFVDSASGPSAAKRDWYVWSPTRLDWTQPWGGSPTWHERNGAYYYGVFWGGMPDLNYTTEAVRAEAKRVAAYWLGKGVDGFRLDAARYLIETGGGAGQADTAQTHAFWKEFAAHVRSVKPDAALVGENWSSTAVIASYYGDTSQVPGGDELPMNFNFPLAGAILNAASGGDATHLVTAIAEYQGAFPTGATSVPFLTNHDMVRVGTQLPDPGQRKSAAALLLTLPGTPFLYYGEELGLRNGTTDNDEAKRTPMPWNGTQGGGFTTGTPWFPFAPGQATTHVAAQVNDPASLLSRYRALIHTRQGSAALRQGGLRVLAPAGATQPYLAFVRFHPDERVLVVHNLLDSPVTTRAFGLAGTLEAMWVDPGASAASAAAGWTISLPARGSGIWRIRG